MTKIQINAAQDHIAKYVKASPLILGITELIWNSLDAGANTISINTKDNGLNGFEYIDVIDDGEGCSYLHAQNAFKYIGNSYKRNVERTSDGRRCLHGSEGRGRYKALSIGNNVKFYSIYFDKEDNLKKEFYVTLSNNDLSVSDISELKICDNQDKKTGVSIRISAIENKSNLFNESNINLIQEMFAIYYSLYKDFSILLNNKEIDLTSKIKKGYPESGKETINLYLEKGQNIELSLKIIEWDFPKNKKDSTKRLNLCNNDGCPLFQDNLGVCTDNLNISLYVMSDYIAILNNENLLSNLHEDVKAIEKQAQDFLRQYLNIEKQEKRKHFIETLKQENLYPYKDDEIKSSVNNAERELFDVIAVKIDECLPKFTAQEKKSKKLTFSLIKEAIATKSSKLKHILQEVCSLSNDDIDKLDKILEYTSLPNIIATSNEVIDRMRFLTELREFVAGNISAKVKERSQLHKILAKEQWIFGEQYKPGTSDMSLRNVLQAHIKELDRDNLNNEELIKSIKEDKNPELNLIPDLCLWSAIPKDSQEKREHLFIELKRPSQKATTKEQKQINDYAFAVANDNRFTKDNTFWKFILIVTEIEERLRQEKKDNNTTSLNGLYGKGDNFEVYIYTWSYLIEQREGELRRLKEMLDLNLTESPDDFSYLKSVHSELLP